MSIPGTQTPSDRTTPFTLSRVKLIERAYKIIGILEKDQVLDAQQLADGEDALNLIVRETDPSGRWRWTVEESYHLPLASTVSVYTADESQLPDNIAELLTVKYRDAAGRDHPVDTYTAERYEDIPNKSEAGQPCLVYLTEQQNLEDRSLYIWRTPATVQAQAQVEDDNEEYRCIRPHTSSLVTRPGVGANWKMYWEIGGNATEDWAVDTDYASTDQLRLLYRRPLLDFNHANDEPDFPVQWPRMILYKLAFDLGDIEQIPLEERQFMIGKAQAAYKDIFPSVKNKSNQRHNKAKYF